MKIELDALDRRLAAAFTEDGQMSVDQAAKRLGVSGPTVRSRLRNLISSGLVRMAALVDPFCVKGLTVALVGVSLQSHAMLDKKLEQIAALPCVNWAAVVTGRYDILVEVVLSADMTDLYDFLDRDLSQVGGVNASESFVVMKARRKWIPMPRGARERFAGNY